MADITCEVIRDLLPLYVDDVLSSDSRALVEEHLETCEGCTDYYHALKEPEGNYKQMRKSDEKAAFKETDIHHSCHRRMYCGFGFWIVLWPGRS